MRKLTLFCVLALAACDAPPPSSGTPSGQAPSQSAAQAQNRPAIPTSSALAQFKSVVASVEPVAERECNARTQGINCDFRIVVDDRPGQPANAFQTVDKQGRPILAFNLALIAEVRNRDELAFVMGHEAAHHISGHLDRQRLSDRADRSARLSVAGRIGPGAPDRVGDRPDLAFAPAWADR